MEKLYVELTNPIFKFAQIYRVWKLGRKEVFLKGLYLADTIKMIIISSTKWSTRCPNIIFWRPCWTKLVLLSMGQEVFQNYLYFSISRVNLRTIEIYQSFRDDNSSIRKYGYHDLTNPARMRAGHDYEFTGMLNAILPHN